MAIVPVWTLIVFAQSGSIVIDDIASEEEATELGQAIQADAKQHVNISPPFSVYEVLKEFGPINPGKPRRRHRVPV